MAKPGTAARRPDMDNGRSDSFMKMLALEKQYRVITLFLFSRPSFPVPSRLNLSSPAYMLSALGSVEQYSFFFFSSPTHTPGQARP